MIFEGVIIPRVEHTVIIEKLLIAKQKAYGIHRMVIAVCSIWGIVEGAKITIARDDGLLFFRASE